MHSCASSNVSVAVGLPVESIVSIDESLRPLTSKIRRIPTEGTVTQTRKFALLSVPFAADRNGIFTETQGVCELDEAENVVKLSPTAVPATQAVDQQMDTHSPICIPSDQPHPCWQVLLFFSCWDVCFPSLRL